MPIDIKIFKMNENDYVAANNLDEAKQCLADTVNDGNIGADFESEFIEDPFELTSEQLNTIMFYDDENGPSDDPTRSRTFKRELLDCIKRGEDFPQFFASSEY